MIRYSVKCTRTETCAQYIRYLIQTLQTIHTDLEANEMIASTPTVEVRKTFNGYTVTAEWFEKRE